MLSACRYKNYIAILNMIFISINNAFPCSAFKPEELIVLVVCFQTDFFTRLQVHQHQLAVGSRVEHLPEVVVFPGH